VAMPFQVGITITNALINVKKAVNKTFAAQAENLPVIATSVAHGVYMVVISNIRYSIVRTNYYKCVLSPFFYYVFLQYSTSHQENRSCE